MNFENRSSKRFIVACQKNIVYWHIQYDVIYVLHCSTRYERKEDRICKTLAPIPFVDTLIQKDLRLQTKEIVSTVMQNKQSLKVSLRSRWLPRLLKVPEMVSRANMIVYRKKEDISKHLLRTFYFLLFRS